MTSPSDGSRRRALLARAGLTTLESLEYAEAIEGVSDQLSNVASQRRAANVGAGELQRLKTEEDALFEQAEAKLRAHLSAGAVSRLDAYVKGDFKRRIRVFSGGSMK